MDSRERNSSNTWVRYCCKKKKNKEDTKIKTRLQAKNTRYYELSKLLKTRKTLKKT